MARKITVEFIGKDKSLGSTAQQVEGKFSGLGGKLARFGAVAATGFAAAGAGAVAAGTYFFNTGAKLEQMAMKAETVFGGQLGSVDKWARANANAMGLTRREATGLAANFGDLLIPMGFTRKQAAKMSTDVVGLSGALSQWSGGTKSAAEVTDILSAAMLGETDGLKSLGISISAADVEARLLAKGQDKLTGAAKQQAEAQAIQALIMEKSTDAQKAFAEGGSPLLSAQAKIKAKFGEVRDEIALKLLPFMVKGATVLSEKLGPAMAKVGDWIRTKLMPPLKELAQKWLVYAAELWDGLKDAMKDAQPFFDMVGQVLKNVVVPGLKKLFEVAGPALADALRGIGKALGAIGETGKFMWNNVLQPVFKLLAQAVAQIMAGWATMLSAMAKVPGFGWAKDAADKLRGAADKAQGLADNLHKIKDPKLKITANTTPAHNSLTAFLNRVAKVSGQTLTIYANMATSGQPSGGSGPGIYGQNARGTAHWGGGRTWVGETGPEVVDLPYGSKIYSNERSMRMAGAGGVVGSAVVDIKLGGQLIEKLLIELTEDLGRPLQVRTL